MPRTSESWEIPSRCGPKILGLPAAIEAIKAARNAISPHRGLLVAVTGIDGAGKGYVTARIVKSLTKTGFTAVGINSDGWLDLPAQRFSTINPGPHFYAHAIRFHEMFSRLILPLRDRRTVRIEMNYAEETATQFRRHVYDFRAIDIIVLEGVYLLKRAFRHLYDLSFWIECNFETALQRAIARAQEGLSPEETIKAYRTIYFPAQEFHFQRDDPARAATAVITNQ